MRQWLNLNTLQWPPLLVSFPSFLFFTQFDLTLAGLVQASERKPLCSIGTTCVLLTCVTAWPLLISFPVSNTMLAVSLQMVEFYSFCDIEFCWKVNVKLMNVCCYSHYPWGAKGQTLSFHCKCWRRLVPLVYSVCACVIFLVCPVLRLRALGIQTCTACDAGHQYCHTTAA